MKLRASENFSHTPWPLFRVAGLWTLIALLSVPTLAQQSTVASSAAFRDGVVLVGFEPGVSPGGMAAAAAEVGAVDVGTIGAGTHVLHVGAGRVTDTIHALRRNPNVRYAEPDYFVWPAGVPNDTNFNSQWGFQNTGQTVNGVTGTAGADEHAVSAWNLTTGSAGANAVVVAVVDTGVQYNHPDLETNMWSNPGTIGNCPAGTPGFNILNQTCNPMDDDTIYGGHGTHIAGIIGAATNNANGVAGLNWTVQIMAVKWIPASAQGLTSNLISALQWVINAKQAGVNVRVVNDSGTWVGTAFSQALSDEIDLLDNNDILFVTAAGNTAQNNDNTPRYPCVYDRPNQICVAATNQSDNLWSSSNYGVNTVDVAAPGVNIFSTKRSTNYGFISGTSMAAGEVSGAAALILSQGYQSVANLKSLILNNVDPLPSLTNKVKTGGRLNVCNAMPGCTTATSASPVNIVAPVVVSTPQFGHQVGAWTGKWTGSPTSFSYQWSRCDSSGANCAPIVGATSSTYAVLANADVGSTLEVSVTGSNPMGTASISSAASPAVQAAAASSWSVSSTILDGTTISGQVFWQAAPSLPTTSVNNVQFYIDGSLKATDFSSPYNYNGNGTLDTTKLSQGAHVLALRGVANDLSNAYYSAAVVMCNPPTNTGLPGISGTAKEGKTLTSGNGSWTFSPVSFAYQWNRCDSSGANCAAITGATANSYVLTEPDVGSTIRSAVTATNQCGASSTATSNATTVVQASAPSITTTSLPSGTQNVAYSTTLAASGGIQPYTWSIKAGTGNLPTGLSLNSSTGVISGTPTTSGTRSFTLQVTDANSMTGSQALSITISAGVTITTTTLPAGEQNVAYSTTLAASGGTQPYTWTITTGTLPNPLTLNSSTGVISGTPTASGTSSFTVQVTDANSQSGTQALSITIAPLPSITTTTLPGGTQNTAYSTTLAASGGTQPYTWSITTGTLPSGLNLNSSTGVISGAPTVLGTSNFTVQVTDADSQSTTQSLSITIAPGGGGGGIGLVQSAAGQGSSVTSLSQAFPSNNTAGNLIVVFVRASTTNQTVTVTDTALNTYALAVSQTQTTDNHQIGIFYATSAASGPNTVTATFSASNTHPWLSVFEFTGVSALDQTAHAQGSSTSPNTGLTPTTTSNNELVFAGLGLPSASTASITAGTGFQVLLQDAPPNTSRAATEGQIVSVSGQDAGTFTINANANCPNCNWSAVVATFKNNVVGPSITTTTLPAGEQNVAYSTTLAASGGTQPYTWSITTGTPPNGLSLNSGTGVISGTPTASGTSNFTVQVTDANSQSATRALSITIAPLPSITTTTLPGGTQNTAYSTTLAASGGTQPYTWSITTGTLPIGLSLNSGTGVISGTPTASGTSNFTVQVTDADSQSTTQSLSITIAPGGGGGGIGLVQSAAVQGSSVTSLSQAFPSNNTAGNLIVVFVRATSGQTVTVTDTASNTYALAVSQIQTTNSHQIYIFYATSVNNSSNTVTATFSGTNTKPWMAVFEYTGVSVLDKTASAQGSNALPNTGLTATTTSNNELVFAGLGLPSNAGTVTAGTGFQLLLQDAPPNTSRAATEGQITAVSSQYAGTFSLSAGTNWSAVVATFK